VLSRSWSPSSRSSNGTGPTHRPGTFLRHRHRRRGTSPTAKIRPASRARRQRGARYVHPRHFAWADLLRRTFEIDILACPDCGGRLRLLATIEDTEVVAKILAHLNLPIDPPEPSPVRDLDWLPGFAACNE